MPFLDAALAAVPAVGRLSDGDPVLIAEGCTHHRQCNDIGTVKIPRWLRAYSGADIVVETCSGREFPEKLDGYRLVVHCGGCMLNEREIQSRMRQTVSQGVPFINYGVLIALVTGILPRSIRMLNKGVPSVPFINYGVLIALVTGILPRSIRMLNKGVPTETR